MAEMQSGLMFSDTSMTNLQTSAEDCANGTADPADLVGNETSRSIIAGERVNIAYRNWFDEELDRLDRSGSTDSILFDPANATLDPSLWFSEEDLLDTNNFITAELAHPRGEDWSSPTDAVDLINESDTGKTMAWTNTTDQGTPNHPVTVPSVQYQSTWAIVPPLDPPFPYRRAQSAYSSSIDVELRVGNYPPPPNASMMPQPPRQVNQPPHSVDRNALRFIPTKAPITGFPQDPIYDSKPLIDPSVRSADLTRANEKFAYQAKYEPNLADVPRAWDIFRYQTNGELDPAQLYTSAEIARYLFEHPLHEGQDPLTSPLHLLVQHTPARSRHRFPTNLSHRCRFSHCPLPTINQGQYCVAFNESCYTTERHDPFVLAGFVHLWCLERFCDLPRIARELNIQPDRRLLWGEQKQRNPMRIALQHEEKKQTSLEETVLLDFIDACRLGTLSRNYPRYDQPNRPHEGTLTHQLSMKKLVKESSSTARQRLKRFNKAGYQGSTLATHHGDLRMEADLRFKTRRHQNQNQLILTPPKKTRLYEHLSSVHKDHLDDDNDDYDDSEDVAGGKNEDPTQQPPHQLRAPVAQMLPRGATGSVSGTKRPPDSDDEAPSPPPRLPPKHTKKRRLTLKARYVGLNLDYSSSSSSSSEQCLSSSSSSSSLPSSSAPQPLPASPALGSNGLARLRSMPPSRGSVNRVGLTSGHPGSAGQYELVPFHGPLPSSYGEDIALGLTAMELEVIRLRREVESLKWGRWDTEC